MLEIDGLTCRSLAGVSLSVDGGEAVAVSGTSGAGKSVFLRAVADLDTNDGEVRLDGHSRADIPAPAWRRRVVYVPAESGWWADRVRDHFADAEAATGHLHRLQLPADCLDWPVSRLSTGERQRLALVRAMVLAPRVFLLDEPTSGLDPETTLRVEAVLHEQLADGAAMLFVSHDPAQAKRMADRQFRIADGRLEAVGTADAP
ncbi:MAG: ABC transporter ATP-binding protein [Rhodospirillaceae bacterium]